MNTTKSAYKVSKMMKATNVAIFWIFMIQLVFSVAGATYCAYWTEDNVNLEYLGLNMGADNYAKHDLAFVILTMTGSWILIFW